MAEIAGVEQWKVRGRWSPLFEIANVAVHASLLPNGKILHWGRRQDPKVDCRIRPRDASGLEEHHTKSFLWTPHSERPVDGKYGTWEPSSDTSEPEYLNPKENYEKQPVNLFCAGHTFLSTGNLLVCGGHWSDGFGVEQSCVYDYKSKKWIQQTLMARGRWYPTVLALPDGRVLCISGSDNATMNPNINSVPQIYPGGGSLAKRKWIEVADTHPPKIMLDLFPRMHIDPNTGNPVMVGTKPETWILELNDEKGEISEDGIVGRWKSANTARASGFRDYAPSVMYEPGNIMYVGGGGGNEGDDASRFTEFLDLNKTPLQWDKKTILMNHPRKQFNATLLPDGTIFVNGGSFGSGFNDFANPVYTSELLDPSKEPKQWIKMDKEATTRVYHSVSLLLPDGRVWSAGGGEYGKAPPSECHTDAQIFEPPYLFKGDRPSISSAPEVIECGVDFEIEVGSTDSVKKISLIRLGSVTHCRNMSQQFMWLNIVATNGSKLTVSAPANGNIAPPGPYMLFVLNENKIPSIGAMVNVQPLAVSAPFGFTAAADVAQSAVDGVVSAFSAAEEEHIHTEQVQPTIADHNAAIKDEHGKAKSEVVVGLTPLCPYGLGPCWGGAHDGLQAVSDIDVVRPKPSHVDCLAYVYLKEDIIPDIDIWRTEFQAIANKGYIMRGIEMNLTGRVKKVQDDLILAGTTTRADVKLVPFEASDQLKWDAEEEEQRPTVEAETGAHKGLLTALAEHPSEVQVQVTGTLQKHDTATYSLHVRAFKFLDS